MDAVERLKIRRDATEMRIKVVRTLGSTSDGEYMRLLAMRQYLRGELRQAMQEHSTFILGYGNRHSDWR